jgi:hypothetical protein
MALSTRRQFVHQTAFAAAALYGRPIKVLAEARRIFEAREQNAALLGAAAIRKLVSQISGHVITPETPDYESARLVFNRIRSASGGDRSFCRAPDVARALEFAQNQNLPLAVRGGGHSRAGFSVCDGGVVIDLSGMNRVQVEAGKRAARAEAGALVRELDHATQRFGRATTSITCETARDTALINSYLASASMKINSELFCTGSVTLSPFPISSRAVTFRSALLRS